MTMLRAVLFIFAVGLAGAILWAMGADDRGLGPVIAEMLTEPWSIVTLIDLYLGFFIAALIIFLFEKNKVIAALWAAPIFLLGNVWTAVWLVWRLPEMARRLKG